MSVGGLGILCGKYASIRLDFVNNCMFLLVFFLTIACFEEPSLRNLTSFYLQSLLDCANFDFRISWLFLNNRAP